MNSETKGQDMTKLQKILENPYYIYPPRKILFAKFARVWFVLLLCAIGSVGVITLLFCIVYAFLFFHYKPLIRIWGIYYSKFVLLILTLAIMIFSYCVAPFLRGVIWSIICGF